MVVSYGRSSQQVRIGKRWHVDNKNVDNKKMTNLLQSPGWCGNWLSRRPWRHEWRRPRTRPSRCSRTLCERTSQCSPTSDSSPTRQAFGIASHSDYKNACVVPKVYYGKTFIMLSKPLLLGNSVRPDWQNFASLPKCYIFGNFWGFFRHLA